MAYGGTAKFSVACMEFTLKNMLPGITGPFILLELVNYNEKRSSTHRRSTTEVHVVIAK